VWIFLSGTALGTDYEGDLILRGHSDSSIKFLKPPLSLTVIHNQPDLGGSFFLFDGEGQIDQEKVSFLNKEYDLDSILSNSGLIKNTLVKTDPSRLAPAQLGKNRKGVITREVLKNFSREQTGDLFLIFRWLVELEQGSSASISGGLQNQSSGDGSVEASFTLSASGIIYIAAQRKVLALSTVSRTGLEPEKMAEEVLKRLAIKAKKIIQAQKKIISKSY
tara:strand:- start:1157 stop:1816 length:660 start_codon:yes stop_codon:yes gene_type:complete